MRSSYLPVTAGLTATVAITAAAMVPAAAGHRTSTGTAGAGPVQAWLTTDDLSQKLSPQPDLHFTENGSSAGQPIAVDEDRTFQKIAGFGATFTDSSAYLMWNRLDPSLRGDVMSRLFDPDNADGIHLSILRQPAGATDFIKDVHGYYTYDDLAAGQTDPDLDHFSIEHDDAYVIPVLREAVRHNPAMKVMLTSWSPPAWMKTNGSIIDGGTLKEQFYRSYADYLVRAIQAYQQRGIPIWATSAQNEPSVTQTYPSMTLSSTQEATFVQQYFRPALTTAGLSPLLFTGDDVCFSASYPAAVLDHPGATGAFDAVSMHGYCGNYQAMTTMHALQPDFDIYQTELSPGCQSQNPAQLVIGAMRNWARSAITWNVALDPRGGPFHRDDASNCIPLVTVGDDGKPTYNAAYYREGQASRFVRPGAERIASTGDGPVQHVAFRNPDGQKVLLAYNSGSSDQEFTVRWGSRTFSYTLPGKGTITFTWDGTPDHRTYGWGDSTFGADTDNPNAGGQQTGTWDLRRGGEADSTGLGAAWNSTFLGYADLRDFSVRADVRPGTAGTTVGAPKYGIYACYHDADNYVQGWLDPDGHSFDTHAVVSGMDLGWDNTKLDPDVDLSAAHRIEARRHGTSVTFLLDGKTVARSVAPAMNCQIGLVTQDHTAQFRNVSVRS